ncbi:hypothetical protein HMPREF0198_0381 [Cardiobacterium hominis ATCC 15826]|uniref:Uncharacterized protein n=1 Tax=Cardiobacterium hominis (strain ATCC 15826 / DSM 8339 / NCTC 10426 / 6573) TaxID=638300 RepID=C8N7A4_CARH6|nr:hypothetical protein HMPREF0198_0381 [Cardiobacterium hominis ATCC 15826]
MIQILKTLSAMFIWLQLMILKELKNSINFQRRRKFIMPMKH